MNLVPLYKDCALLPELENYLASEGFNRTAMETPWHPTWGDALYVRRPLITMTSLGQNGRFANQLFQYLYLRLLAENSNAVIQTPEWVGTHLFGLVHAEPIRNLPVLSQGGVRGPTNPKAILADAARMLEEGASTVSDIDLWGYFQLHGRDMRKYRERARQLFTPVPVLADRLRGCLDKTITATHPTLVALHLRRSDYGYGPFYRAPCSWYETWVNSLDVDPRNTVIYLASEEPGRYRNRFSQYRVLTAREVSSFPADFDWFVDFHVLRNAHHLAISNSSFSFMASLLNENLVSSVRPSIEDWGLVDFDPTDSPVMNLQTVPDNIHALLGQID